MAHNQTQNFQLKFLFNFLIHSNSDLTVKDSKSRIPEESPPASLNAENSEFLIL